MTTTTYGTKYNTNLTTTEIAAAIRADIKAAQKTGALPKGVKISVKTDYFSGGSSIDLTIKAFPGQRIHTPAGVVQSASFDFIHPSLRAPRYEAPVQAVLDTLEALHKAYNYNGSDISSDYFHVRFYGSVTVGWELSRDDRKAVEATITPEQKAEWLNV